MGGPTRDPLTLDITKKGHSSHMRQDTPNPALVALLTQTGTLVPGKDETTIQIKFISGKITWPREHVDYITAREPNCLWRITDIWPDTNNNIMAIVNPVKRNNSKSDTRIVPIKVAKTLITRHINREMVDLHDPLEDFPNIDKQMQLPTKNLYRYFTHETFPFSVQRRTQNPNESRPFLNVDRHHNFSLNRCHIILAIQSEPITGRGDIPRNPSHSCAPDRFISDDEILELLNHVRNNPTTGSRNADNLGSTTNNRLPKCSNSRFQQYMRISRPAWNIFLKCYLCLRPKTDNPITINFHDTWDALVKQNNNALRNRPGIGYLINHGRPSGLEWTCIGKTAAPSTHIHTSFQLQKLIESKTTNWPITKDWTNQHIDLSHLEWNNLEIPKLAYQSTIVVNGYFFQPGNQAHIKILQNSLQQAHTRSKTIQPTSPDTTREQRLDPVTVANMWQQLNPTVDPFASLPKQYYHTVTNAFATNVIVGDQTSPGMESIFALQFPNWLHDAIITWWLGYWCEKTGGLSNFSITNQRQRPSSKIDGQRKTFFATPFFWKFVLDAEIRGANETKYVDIFTCSRMLIPVNIKLKHWILACIDFEQKWIAWFDSIDDTYEQETRLLFA